MRKISARLRAAHRWIGAPVLVVLPFCLPANAQNAARTGIEEVIVTAERREASLQQTPIAITALTGEAIRERGLVDLRNIADVTPNMSFTYGGNGSGGGNFAQVFLRGVGQQDFIITKDNGVGIYIDGVYLSRAPGAVLELLDIERVEVLRGPQGTLFGKNTEGGAVSVITKRPSGDFDGTVELVAGNYHRFEGKASVEFPIVEGKVAARVSGLSRNRDGYYERLLPNTGKDGNNENVRSGRLSVRFTPSDTVEVLLAADVTTERQQQVDYQARVVSADPVVSPNTELYNRVVGIPNGTPYDQRWIATEPWTTYSTWPGYNNSSVQGTSATFSWKPGPVTLKSITAYRRLHVGTKTDADGTPLDIVASNGIEVQQHQVSQELQMSGEALNSRLKWVTGLWYFHEGASDSQSSNQLSGLVRALQAAPLRSISPPGVAASVCPANGTGPATCLGGANNANNLRYDQTRLGFRNLDGDSYAAFLHTNLQVTDQLSLTAGGRFSKEKKAFKYFETRPLQNNLISFNNVTAGDSWKIFTPKLGLEFKPNTDWLLYASFSRGFKAGGVNGRPTRPDLFNTFGPEWLTAYEVGAKTDLLDHRLRINAAAFLSTYRGIQVTRNTVDSTGAFIRVEQNGGNGEIRGFEIEATAAPVDNLLLTASAGYTDFKFTSLAPQQAAAGTVLLTLANQLPFISKLKLNASAAYTVPLAGTGSVTLRGDYAHASKFWLDIENTPGFEQPSHHWINARISFQPVSKRWEAYLFATNLTNEAIIANGVSSPANGNQIVSYKPPRMWGAGMRFDF